MIKLLLNFNLKKKFFIAFLLPVFIYFMVFMGIHINNKFVDSEEETLNEIQRELDKQVLVINSFFRQKETLLQTLSSTQQLIHFLQSDSLKGRLRPKDEKFYGLKATLNNVIQKDSTIRAISVMIEKSLDYIDHSDWVSADDYFINKRYWYQALQTSKKAYYENIIYDELNTGELLLPLRLPIRVESKFIGGMGLDFSIDELSRQFKNVKLSKYHAQLLVVGKGSQIIHHPNINYQSIENASSTSLINIDKLDSLDHNELPFASLFGNPEAGERHKRAEAYFISKASIDNPQWDLFIAVKKSDIYNPIISSLMNQIYWLVAFIAVLVLLIVIINRSISMPMININNAIRDILEGHADLTKKLNIAQEDEIGDFARLFDQFIVKQRNLIELIYDKSMQVTEASVNINELSQNSDTMFKEIISQSSDIVSSSHQLSVAAKEINSTAEQSAKNINQSIDISNSNVEKIRAVLGAVSNLSNQIENISGEFNILKGFSNEIQRFSESISDLADRLQILSLNSKLQAMKDGGGDSAFAVVSEEMNLLSEKTIESTRTIFKINSKIVTEMEHLNKRILHISSNMDNYRHSITDAIDKLELLKTANFTLQNNMDQITGSYKEQNTVLLKINDHIASLNKRLKLVSRDIKDTQTYSVKMMDSVSDLVSEIQSYEI